VNRRIRVASAAALALGLVACSDPSVRDAPAGGAASWADPTAPLDGVRLTAWAAQNGNTVPERVVAAFEQATGATVDVVTIPDPYEQGIQTKVATGDKPDLAFSQPTASMLTAINARTNLQPLDDAPWLPKVAPELRDITGILDGTRYATLDRKIGFFPISPSGRVGTMSPEEVAEATQDQFAQPAKAAGAPGF
jgi:raffinose/stachyose/melibiose transport system substrate-binding protein